MQTQTKPATLELTGASGRKYAFSVHPWGTSFKPIGGVYAVTKATSTASGGQTHKILYIGQTGDLSERFDDHHKEPCFRRNGVTHICVHVQGDEQERLGIERDLVAAYYPPCNG